MRDLIFTASLWLGGFGLALIVLSKFGERYVAKMRGIIGERRVRAIIKAADLPAVHGLYAVDNAGVHTQIDHVVKVPAGFVVIETKNFMGSLYGQANDKSWRHINGPFRRTIQNPLRQNYRHVKTLEELFPGIECLNLVCFMSGRFPKGIPSGVTTKETLPGVLQSLAAADIGETTKIDEAWEKLTRMAAGQGSSDRRAHIKNLKERFARHRE